jgi:hypothetical protein
MDEALGVEAAERGGEANSDAQKGRHRHRPSQQSIERLAARVGEDEHRPPLVRGEGERPDGPPGVELGP